MFSIHTLRTVARFEMKTLLRSWFFRIFAGLAIVGLGIFNITVFVESSSAPWIFRALPASIPYANLIVLNLGQAIVAVFLASEFLKQDRKNDSVEVIYARSMTNAEYILGKALGILSVFFILNIIVLLMGIGFSFMSSDSSQGIWEFFYYPLLISLPTLVFILGLSFFMMILLKNQAITFIVLLGYIALTIFYLNTRYYHLFDYIAYQVPMMNSTIAGFGNIQEVLVHRGIYLFLGLGLILFTVFKLQRLPQSSVFSSFPLYLALGFIFTGVFFGYKYIDLKKSTLDYKQQLIEINNRYVDVARVHVDSCNIDLEHFGKQIAVQADLIITNRERESIDTLLFSLNPSLKLITAKLDGVEIGFDRELHLLKLMPDKAINPQEKRTLTLSYRGTINENTHFLDKNPQKYEDNFSQVIFRIRKRYAYLQDDFVCLTRDALWYPVSGVGYASVKPALFFPDFTNFSLRVKTQEQLMAVSQGESTKVAQGVYEFVNEESLTQISLLIGDYRKRSVLVDSVEYGIYTIDGNQYYEEHFDAIADSLPGVIRELKNEYENTLGLQYPYKRLSLAEVPIHFALDKHIWSVSSDAVQPQLLFYPEKGVELIESDFKKRKKRFEKRMKRDNEDVASDELQSRMFKRFIRANYMATPQEWYGFRGVTDRNTFTLFPNYCDFVTQLKSVNYSVLNLALSIYLKERNISDAGDFRWAFQGVSKQERINLELKEASLHKLLKKGIPKSSDDEEELTLHDVIIAKGDNLFSLMRAQYGAEEFDALLISMIKKHKGEAFCFKSFDAAMQKTFNGSVSEVVDNWYEKQQLPGFLVRDLKTYKVKQGEYVKYQVRFKISNPESVDGIVTVNVDLNDPNRRRRRRRQRSKSAFSKKIYVPANSAREVGFLFSSEPSRMNVQTHVSENLPNNLVYDFGSFDEVRKSAVLDEIVECEFFDNILNDNEIVVDNEDEGFEIYQVSNKSYLKSLIDKNKKSAHKYSRFKFWSPPNEWKTVLRSGFYGKYVRSGLYTKSGQGERTATWKAPLKQEGFYDVYCHIEKVDFNWRRQKRKADYHFQVYHDDGVEQVVRSDEELEKGWNYLGSFYISRENAKVVLSNQSVGSYLFADAIKWVANN